MTYGLRQHDDFDVFDGKRDVGRIYKINAAAELWWWGVSFQLTGRKGYGMADSLDGAKAAFRAEYVAWKDHGAWRSGGLAWTTFGGAFRNGCLRDHMDWVSVILTSAMVLIGGTMSMGFAQVVSESRRRDKARKEEERWRREQQERQQREAKKQQERQRRQDQEAEERRQETKKRQEERHKRERKPENTSSSRRWWEVLDVSPDATLAEAERAYRLKMQQCHPDKVASLAPEFIQLAEQKSRELNAALAQVRQVRR